jgi:hypothetical protein
MEPENKDEIHTYKIKDITAAKNGIIIFDIEDSRNRYDTCSVNEDETVMLTKFINGEPSGKMIKHETANKGRYKELLKAVQSRTSSAAAPSQPAPKPKAASISSDRSSATFYADRGSGDKETFIITNVKRSGMKVSSSPSWSNSSFGEWSGNTVPLIVWADPNTSSSRREGTIVVETSDGEARVSLGISQAAGKSQPVASISSDRSSARFLANRGSDDKETFILTVANGGGAKVASSPSWSNCSFGEFSGDTVPLIVWADRNTSDSSREGTIVVETKTGGARVSLSISQGAPTYRTCRDCNGSGNRTTDIGPCPNYGMHTNGVTWRCSNGRVPMSSFRNGYGMVSYGNWIQCPVCGGSGRNRSSTGCYTCFGKGKVRE